MDGIDFIEPGQANRNNRHAKTNSHHADPRAKRVNLSIPSSDPLRKDEGTITPADEIPCVQQRASGTRHLLREWVGVVNCTGEEI